MATEFTIPQRAPQTLEFALLDATHLDDGDGAAGGDRDRYHFLVPKRAALLLDAVEGGGVTARMFAWLERGLNDWDDEHDTPDGERQSARLVARLRDPDDDLDTDTILKVANAMIGESVARPTQAP